VSRLNLDRNMKGAMANPMVSMRLCTAYDTWIDVYIVSIIKASENYFING
jgi:hypothetical protein